MPKVQLLDQILVTISFRFAQIIEQAPPLRDHLEQAPPRRMIFLVSLKVLSQMLDPAGEKCDLHIRAASIFVMQLELLEIQRLVALCHNEGRIVTEEPILATEQTGDVSRYVLLSRMSFPFAVVPKGKLFTRTDAPGTADDYAKEFAQKMFRRIHAQFPG